MHFFFLNERSRFLLLRSNLGKFANHASSFRIASMLSTTGYHYHPLHRADDAGSTPLLEAVRGGYHAIVKLLLGKGANLELREPGTVLCDAVLTGNVVQLKLLLDCGADANATNYVRWAPFFSLCRLSWDELRKVAAVPDTGSVVCGRIVVGSMNSEAP
jgi:ankyrin repeat protein